MCPVRTQNLMACPARFERATYALEEFVAAGMCIYLMTYTLKLALCNKLCNRFCIRIFIPIVKRWNTLQYQSEEICNNEPRNKRLKTQGRGGLTLRIAKGTICGRSGICNIGHDDLIDIISEHNKHKRP